MSLLPAIIATATTALDDVPVYTDLIPDNTALPYAVVTLIGSTAEYTVCDPYVETTSYQIAIWDTTLAGAESLAATVDLAFNRVNFESYVIETDRTNYVIPPVQIQDQLITYGAILEYETLWNRSVGTT